MLLVWTLVSNYRAQVAFFQNFHTQHLIMTHLTHTHTHTHTHTQCENLLNFPHTPTPGPGCPGDNFEMTPHFSKSPPFAIRHKRVLIYCAIMLLHFCLAEIFCLMFMYMHDMHMMFLHVIIWLYGSVIE